MLKNPPTPSHCSTFLSEWNPPERPATLKICRAFNPVFLFHCSRHDSYQLLFFFCTAEDKCFRMCQKQVLCEFAGIFPMAFFFLAVTLNRGHKHACATECIMCDGAHRRKGTSLLHFLSHTYHANLNDKAVCKQIVDIMGLFSAQTISCSISVITGQRYIT